MPNNWKIKKGDTTGGDTGKFLEGCEVRKKVDGNGYELIAILAESHDNNLPVNFPPFAYRGLIWNIFDITSFDHGDLGDQPYGNWNNNAPKGPPGEEDGTWTAQAGAGGMEGDKGKEDAASASV